MPDTPLFTSLFTPEFVADPHPVLAALRQRDPIYRVQHPLLDAWLVTSYEHVTELFRDPRLQPILLNSGIGKAPSAAEHAALSPVREGMQRWFSYLPPARHRRIQRVLRRYFASRVVTELEPTIAAIASELLDAMADKTVVDMVSAFAQPLPIRVIARMLGAPAEDCAQFTGWSQRLSTIFLPFDFATHSDAQQAYLDMARYCAEQIHQRQQHQQKDIFSVLATAVANDEISEAEATASCVFLMFAGHQTTARFLAASIYQLAGNTTQLTALASDPAFPASFVEEVLRYQGGPLATWSMRVARADLTIAGHRIKQGDTVLLDRTAANHDPARFTCPHQFDPQRSDNAQHLTFGHGTHHCLGAGLARAELTIALQALARRYPQLSVVADDVRWAMPTLMVKHITHLPVHLHATATLRS